MNTQPQHHPTQKTQGALAERHASVLLARNPTELEAAYDKWAGQYDEDLGEISGLGDQWGRSAVRVIEQRGYLPSKYPKLLDFGCGTGLAGGWLKDMGWSNVVNPQTVLHACDLSAGMLQVASKRGCYDKLIKSTYESPGCESDYYDLIHASGVFAPGQAPPDTFDKFITLLSPGGMTVFTARTGYYDGDEGVAHREHLESLCADGKWELVSQTEAEYLPKENLSCYVFCMRKPTVG